MFAQKKDFPVAEIKCVRRLGCVWPVFTVCRPQVITLTRFKVTRSVYLLSLFVGGSNWFKKNNSGLRKKQQPASFKEILCVPISNSIQYA
jgi:hypothetical protein